MSKSIKSIAKDLENLGNAALSTALQSLDSVVRGTIKAAEALDMARGNLSASILAVIVAAESPEQVFNGLGMLRGLYRKENPDTGKPDKEYNQYNNALSNVRTGFRRISGVPSTATQEDQNAAFLDKWDEIQAEASKDGMNFAQFWKGPKQKRAAPGNRAGIVQKVAKVSAEKMDETAEGWDEKAYERFAVIRAQVAGAVREGHISQEGADTIIAVSFAVFVEGAKGEAEATPEPEAAVA